VDGAHAVGGDVSRGTARYPRAMTEISSRYSQCCGLSLGHHEASELRSPAADERRLDQVMQAVDRLFDRCEETVHRTGQPILTWLQSQYPTVVARQPFRLVGRQGTRYRYRRIWKRFFPVPSIRNGSHGASIGAEP
jgi:hypothetical protein